MRNTWLAGSAAVVVLLVAGCSSAGNENSSSVSRVSMPTTSSASAPTNQRGAVEVNLGQPVTITGPEGARIVTITDTHLDPSGCDTTLTSEVVQTKFAATIETGNLEQPEWLWASDFYYVAANGKVAQNLEVSQHVDAVNPCRDSHQLIGVPPNSLADGSPTIVVPIYSQAIGYKLTVGDATYRVEWRLPADWQRIRPAPEPTETTTAPPVETTEPTSDPTPNPNIPPGWDKDGNGQIDTDAPVG